MGNVNSGSNGYLTSVAVTASTVTDIFIIDEDKTDGSYIVDGTSGKKALLKRTFRAGMYNTLCIPVEPGVSELTRIFGEGYEILKMESAEMEGTILNLNFTPVTGSLLACTPYLVKPTKDVYYPKFDSHTIHVYSSNFNKSGSNANFIGSLVKINLEADPNILFLGANNMVYFPEATVPMKGTRAYFQVHDAPAGAISRARIVEHGQVATEIELVGNTLPTEFSDSPVRKLIQNGQLIIIRDGVEYNVMGVRVK